MADVDLAKLGPLFYTGASRFLQANPHFVRAMVAASSNCPIHASEDIHDATGLKLWSRGRSIDHQLLERLSERRLRKPIELCVYAVDPVASAAIAREIEVRVSGSADLMQALGSDLARVLKVVSGIVPSPTELMLLSVMRHGCGDMMGHAALVCAVSLAVAAAIGVHADLMRTLARAALLHDIGEIYLPPSPVDSPVRLSSDRIREIRTHVVIGAQVAIELARSGQAVGHLIALSHERLNGSGYPRGVGVDDLPLPAQALLFAEAIADLLGSQTNGLRRAAVAARLVPGEFAPDMVDWVSRHGRSGPPASTPEPSTAGVGAELREIHGQLAQALVVVKLPMRETNAVRAAAARWLEAIDALIWVLRATGVEDALSCGMNLEPQDEIEGVELSVLVQELRHRIGTLELSVELSVADKPELASSSLVIELLKVLGSRGERAGEGAAEATPTP
jgi:HD domain-containing protein